MLERFSRILRNEKLPAVQAAEQALELTKDISTKEAALTALSKAYLISLVGGDFASQVATQICEIALNKAEAFGATDQEIKTALKAVSIV